MAPTARVLLFFTVACQIVVSCAPDSSDATQAASDAPQVVHGIPADSVGVTGTAECGFFDTGTDPENPEEEGSDLVRCELDMSDPRVSGAETHDRFRYYDLGDDAFAWVAEDAIITNDEGTWRGIAQASDDGTPIGEAHYTGEGGYDGLEFHYYFSHTSIAGKAELRGWISGEGP